MFFSTLLYLIITFGNFFGADIFLEFFFVENLFFVKFFFPADPRTKVSQYFKLKRKWLFTRTFVHLLVKFCVGPNVARKENLSTISKALGPKICMVLGSTLVDFSHLRRVLYRGNRGYGVIKRKSLAECRSEVFFENFGQFSWF